MKAFLFKVTLVSGLAFMQTGISHNVNEALMDACDTMAQDCDYPQDDIEDIVLVKTKEAKA